MAWWKRSSRLSFSYTGRAVDVKQVGRELGVRYVLEGSIRKAAQRVRITGQLIDSTSGVHLWADRFDGAFSDILDLQSDEIAASQLAVDGKIEYRQITRPLLNLKFGPDSPDMLLS